MKDKKYDSIVEKLTRADLFIYFFLFFFSFCLFFHQIENKPDATTVLCPTALTSLLNLIQDLFINKIQFLLRIKITIEVVINIIIIVVVVLRIKFSKQQRLSVYFHYIMKHKFNCSEFHPLHKSSRIIKIISVFYHKIYRRLWFFLNYWEWNQHEHVYNNISNSITSIVEKYSKNRCTGFQFHFKCRFNFEYDPLILARIETVIKVNQIVECFNFFIFYKCFVFFHMMMRHRTDVHVYFTYNKAPLIKITTKFTRTPHRRQSIEFVQFHQELSPQSDIRIVKNDFTIMEEARDKKLICFVVVVCP